MSHYFLIIIFCQYDIVVIFNIRKSLGRIKFDGNKFFNEIKNNVCNLFINLYVINIKCILMKISYVIGDLKMIISQITYF